MPFGFFKKKETEKGKSASVTPEMPQTDSLSLEDVQSLIDNIESTRTQVLSTRLEPVRDSVIRILASLAATADGMEKEKLKLEDIEKRFGSNIENSRKTVVSTLRRETSSQLPEVNSLSDARKLKEKMESMLNRFGEVAGSHSKMLNYFLKKYASSIRHSLSELEDLLKETKSIISSFEQERSPSVKCSNLVNTIFQKKASIKDNEQSIQSAQRRLSEIESDLTNLKEELSALTSSDDYKNAKAAASRLAELEERQTQFHGQVADAFSHVSRAFSKYSYGVSKETERRLRVLSDEPWVALEEPDISPYSSLIAEVYTSVTAGQISLKDSDKVLQNLASIQSSLPQMQKDANVISSELASLSQVKIRPVQLAKELEMAISQYEEGVLREKQLLGQMERQIAETKSEVESLLNDASEALLVLTGKRYVITAC